MVQSLFSKVSCVLLAGSVIFGACVKPSQDSKVASIEAQARSSKKITFLIGPLARSVTIAQVEEFARNPRAQNDFSALLRTGKINTDQVREQLSKSYAFDLLQMDKILNSQVGVALLTRLGEAVHPHSSKATSVQAVRSAIILSLADDNRLSPLEVLSNLPVDMDVEVGQVLKLKDELSGVFGQAVL